MASITIPFLSGGVSTQPPAVRRGDQVEAADNVLFSVHRGAEKRPGTHFVANLFSGSDADYYTHWIDRDPTERYLFMINENGIKVFNVLTGAEIDVAYGNTAQDGYTAGEITALQAYVEALPSTLKMVSIADVTMLVNKSVTVAMDSDPPNTFANINNTPTSGTAMFATATTVQDASALPNTSPTNDDFYYADAAWPFVSTHPHLEIRYLKGYYVVDTGSTEYNSPVNLLKYQRRWVDTVELLPRQTKMPKASRVMNAGGTEPNPYMEVKNSSVNGILGWRKGTIDGTSITWERVPPPGVDNCYFDRTTMPVKITRMPVADATVASNYSVTEGEIWFKIEFIEWNPRYNGDDETNPLPSFVGNTISDMAWHRNRLWFASGENLIGSAAGDFYNFFLEDYTDPVANDRMDLATSSKSVTEIFFIIPFDNVLVLYCNGGKQFELRSDEEGLSSFTATIVPSTQYEVSDTVEPVVCGRQVYFVSSNAIKPNAYEYYFDERTGEANTVANRISAHIEGYLSPDIYEIISSDEDQSVYFLNSNELYCYRYHWEQGEKLQSAWSKYVYDDADYITGAFAFDNNMYMVVRQLNAGTYYYRLLYQPIKPELPATGEAFTPNLDWKISSTGVYDAVTNTTTWTLGTADLGSGTYKGVLSNSFDHPSSILTPYLVTPLIGPNTTSIIMFGDYSDGPVTWGREYEMNLTLSPPYIRDENGVAIIKGDLTVQYLSISHRDTGYYTFNLVKANGDEWYQYYNNFTLGGLTLGSPTISPFGEFEVSIHDKREYYTASIVSSSAAPAVINSLSYTVRYASRRS